MSNSSPDPQPVAPTEEPEVMQPSATGLVVPDDEQAREQPSPANRDLDPPA